MDTAVADTPSTRPLLRRSLQAGVLFFVGKGCAWLLAAGLLGGLL